GQRPDSYVARLLGISVAAVKHRRLNLKILRRPATPRFFQEWKPEEDALLGTASDAEIARRLKCASSTVRLRRSKLKIAACVPNWTPQEDALLKQFSDR